MYTPQVKKYKIAPSKLKSFSTGRVRYARVASRMGMALEGHSLGNFPLPSSTRLRRFSLKRCVVRQFARPAVKG